MKAIAQTLGLHPGVAFFVFVVDMMLFGADITGVGWLLSCAVAAVLTVPAFLMQRNAYGDEWQVALAKALMVGLLTAIPTPLPGFLTATAGVVGIGGKLLGCGRRRALLAGEPALPVTPRICCPSCGRQGQWQNRFEGRDVICPQCKSQFAARMAAPGSAAPASARPWDMGGTPAILAGCLVAALALAALTEALLSKPAAKATAAAAPPGADALRAEAPVPVESAAAAGRVESPGVGVVGTFPSGVITLDGEWNTEQFGLRLVPESPPVLVAPTIEMEGLDEQRVGRAVLKILGAAGVEMLGREVEQSIDQDWRPLFGPMLREVRKAARNELIERAVADVFPELPQRAIRVLRIVIGQIIDGKAAPLDGILSFGKDEVIELIRGYDEELARLAKVQLFILRVALAKYK